MRWAKRKLAETGLLILDPASTNLPARQNTKGTPLETDKQYHNDDCGHDITLPLCSSCERSPNTAAIACKLLVAFITSFEQSLADCREDLEHSIDARLKLNPYDDHKALEWELLYEHRKGITCPVGFGLSKLSKASKRSI